MIRLKRARRTAKELARDSPAVALTSLRLRNDPLWRDDAVAEALRPRPAQAPRRRRVEAADRVLAAYHLAIGEQARRHPAFRPSNEWLPIYRGPLTALIEALKAGDPHRLVDLLDGLYRSPVSLGLCGLPTDMTRRFFSRPPGRYRRAQYLADSLHRWRLLTRLVPGVRPDDLFIPDAGNPYGLDIDGAFVRVGADYQYFYARRVCELAADLGEPRPVVAELGGGLGGFAYFVAKMLPGGGTYIDLDLPEVLAMAQYLLLTTLPGEEIVLYGEVDDLSPATLARARLALLPCFAVEDLAAASVTITFNAYSLAEMDPGPIRRYARELSRVTTRAIYHVNHVARAKLGADHFEFDPRFVTVERRRAEWNLGRYLDCDEFEYLMLADRPPAQAPAAVTERSGSGRSDRPDSLAG